MKKLYHWLLLWFLMGEQYFVLEALYRFFFKGGELAHIAMLPVGGLCVVLVGAINQWPRFYRLPIVLQAAFGTLITLAVEFTAGVLLNIRLGLAIWDYTGMWGNIRGQVCVTFAGIWFLLMPLAIWLEDTARFKLWDEGEYYTLGSIYRDFITAK